MLNRIYFDDALVLCDWVNSRDIEVVAIAGSLHDYILFYKEIE